MTNANEPATGYGFTTADGQSHVDEKGLTKREHFAAMAMQGLCLNGAWDKGIQKQCDNEKVTTSVAIATYAVDLADALIEALNNSQLTNKN